jgi:hypothetical protein
MTAKLISGAEIAKQIREEIKQEVIELKAKHHIWYPVWQLSYSAATPVPSPTSAAKKKPPRNSGFIQCASTCRNPLPKKTCWP